MEEANKIKNWLPKYNPGKQDRNVLTNKLAPAQQLQVGPEDVGRVVGHAHLEVGYRQTAQLCSGDLPVHEPDAGQVELSHRPQQPVPHVRLIPLHRV